MVATRGRRKPGRNRRQPLTAEQRLLGRDAPYARELGEQWFPEGTLDRLETAPSQEMQDIYGDYGRIADQYSNGGRSAEQQTQLDRFNAIQGQYSDGGRSDAMSGALTRYEGFLEGYSGQEGQAMREQAERGLNRQYNTQARAVEAAGRRNRLSGAAQSAQLGDLNQLTMQAQGDIETDLAVRGADERRRALDAYAGRLSQQEADEYQRQFDTITAAGDYLTGQEDREYDRRRGAMSDRYEALDRIQERERDAQIFNAQQGAAELAGRYGTYLEFLGLQQQREQQRAANQQNRRGIDVYERFLNRGYSNSGDSEKPRNTGVAGNRRSRRR